MSKLSNGVKIPPKLPHNPLTFFFSHSLETLAVKPHNDRHWRGLIWLDGCSRYSVSWCIMVYHDVSCTEDMSRYAQYLQHPARHRNKGDGWRRMETDGDRKCGQSQRCQHSTQHSIAYWWSLHYTVSELSLSDTWSPWLRSSAAFGQRWIPCGNIDCFASSFSGHKIWRNGLFSSLLYTHLGTTPWLWIDFLIVIWFHMTQYTYFSFPIYFRQKPKI